MEAATRIYVSMWTRLHEHSHDLDDEIKQVLQGAMLLRAEARVARLVNVNISISPSIEDCIRSTLITMQLVHE